MSGREGAINRARARAAEQRVELGRELRRGRLQHGLSLRQVGGVAGLSAAQASRLERGLVGSLDLATAAAYGAAVGFDLVVRLHPAGDPIRDAAHLELLASFRRRLHRSVRWRSEAPLPIAGDRRAWDALLLVDRRPVGVEAETRIRDLQALLRRIALKRRDGALEDVILLLADTRHHRRIVRAHADDLAFDYPVPGRLALQRLAAGAHPGGGAVLLL